ncbi:unnamed protein product [Mytilus coruscus]|uniref:THAP-type domain-containing protein n=1 Tax=Mytilus coruscus TaxID=42192 RepID=A0A6J8D0I2_MYTCO|nr:unnamed protein product [Mytilus coruscus]
MDAVQVKHKSEGVKHCCYGTCNSDTRYRHRDDMKDVFFIPFPKPITQREKCERWIKACGRLKEDFNVDKIKRYTYMCSKHFVGGKGPTDIHPDPMPALLHNDEQVKHKSEGVKHCCYGTCNSDTRYRHRGDMKDVFFIPFPKPITQREKCERWIKACGRLQEDFNVDKIKRYTYMCSKHFVGGKGPTDIHPDPMPALLHKFMTNR